MTLLPNGKINDPASPNTWTLRGKVLVLRWVDRQAPGGAWVGTCSLYWDRKRERLLFVGFNQRTARVTGYKGNLPPWWPKRRQELLAGRARHEQLLQELRASRAWEEAHWAELHPPTPRPDGRVNWPDNSKSESQKAAEFELRRARMNGTAAGH